MTNDELNEKIRQACTHAAPDVLDAVLSDCNEQKGRVILMTTENKKKTWAVRMAGLAAGLCLILGGGLGVRNYQVNHTVDATVSLDVNPSVEIKINQKERILDVIPLNEDGRTIVGDMDFSGSSLDVAVNAIIGSMLQNGYLNELANSVLISVDNNDPVRGMALQERLTDEVNKLLQTDSFRGAVLSQTVVKSDELQQMAEQYGITLGKAQLIQEILGKNSLHTFDELAPLSINELNILLGKEGAETHVEVVGTASEKGYIGETKAKEIALAKAGVSESDLTFYTVGLDTHKGVMVYDVEFISGSYEFDCEVNAMTGEIVKFEKEYDGVAVSNVSVEEHGKQSEHSQTEENQAVSNISLEKAKEIALNHAGVKATDATFVKAKSDYEDGRAVFEIEFVVSSGNTIKEYDYEIAASDGSIISYDYDIEGDSTPTAIQAGSSQNTSEISLEKAKEIALDHAGVKATDATFVKAKSDYEDGRAVFEIEFVVSSGNTIKEYDYEIAASDGRIISYDYDIEGDSTPTAIQAGSSQNTSEITLEKAKEIALSHAGVASANAFEMEGKLDWDDGMSIYEIEFKAGGYEYSYEVDAATGSIVKFDKEWDD